MKWDEERNDRLRQQWGKVAVRRLARSESTSVGAVYRQARKLGLKTQPRKWPAGLRRDHPAIVGRTTKFPGTITSARNSPRVLIGGNENYKLGRRVTKGKWAGLYIYSVTLTERKTCPTSCLEWLTCYGNSMRFARRHILDRALMKSLDVEIDQAAARHPGGFLVRLHVLGDFGATAREALPYVAFWADRMREVPQLHLFGFTAHKPESPIGVAIMRINLEFPDRCRIRFSGTDRRDGFGALVIKDEVDAKHVVCPFEAERPKRPKNCGACGLCWTMLPPVEFVEH